MDDNWKETKMNENDLLQLEVLGLENDIAHLKFIIKDILGDLPNKRDWLNPETERLAREAVKE